MVEESATDQPAPSRVKELLEAGEIELLDVRTDHEWDSGHIPGARHVELNELTGEADRLGKQQKIVVYCRTGNRSGMASEALRSGGFDAVAMDGGITAWKEADLPLDPPDGYVAESGEAAAILESEGRFPVDKVDPPEETSN
jgi:rhodanese-related sulfurtransferase